MSTIAADPITFSRSFTGYNRQQVDDFVKNMRQYAAQLELRAVEAESRLKSRDTELAETQQQLSAARTSDIPARLEQILELAHEEADDIRQKARLNANQVSEQAVRDAELLLADASAWLADVERETTRLSTIRENYLDDLRNLGSRITQMTESYGNDEGDSDDHAAPTQELEHEPSTRQFDAGATVSH